MRYATIATYAKKPFVFRKTATRSRKEAFPSFLDFDLVVKELKKFQYFWQNKIRKFSAIQIILLLKN